MGEGMTTGCSRYPAHGCDRVHTSGMQVTCSVTRGVTGLLMGERGDGSGARGEGMPGGPWHEATGSCDVNPMQGAMLLVSCSRQRHRGRTNAFTQYTGRVAVM
jgi:hypothetical protein